MTIIPPRLSALPPGPPPLVVVHPDAETLAAAIAARLAVTIADAQAQHAPVHIGLTGGSLGIATLAALAESPLLGAIDVSGLHLWWGDERFEPTYHADRNDTQAYEALLTEWADERGLPESHIHSVAGPDEASTPEEAAARYADELASFAPAGTASPAFDVLLLGVGPDRHIASLFPGQPGASDHTSIALAVHDSPKPPPTRVSLGYRAINAATQVWFIVSGTDKAAAVADGLAGRDPVEAPVCGARGSARTLWLIDLDAASDLEKE